MESRVSYSIETMRQAHASRQYPDILTDNRFAVDTANAAHWMSRRPQTLRGWACRGDGPIQPLRINGRLAWKVSDIRALLGVSK